MKQLIILFSILLLSTIAGLYWIKEPGFVMILFHGWQIQTSLVVLGIVIILSVIIISFFYDLLQFFHHFPKKIIQFFKFLISLRNSRQLRLGLQAYFQENWQEAVKHFSHSSSSIPWVIDLIAAQAAQNQGNLKARDQYLTLATVHEPKACDTILLFQANLQFQQGQYEQCQASLQRFIDDHPSVPAYWYDLQCKIHQQFKEYSKGLQLLKKHRHLQKNHPFYDEAYKTFLMACLKQYLNHQEFEKAYQELRDCPKTLKDHDDLLILCAPFLIQKAAYTKFINQWIKKSIKLRKQPIAILKLLEKLPTDPQWLKILNELSEENHPSEEFYLYLAKIKSKHQLWGTAIQDIEKSLKIKETPEGYSTLAKIYLELQQTSNALNAMQKAIYFQQVD